jgi:hypothetical protein
MASLGSRPAPPVVGLRWLAMAKRLMSGEPVTACRDDHMLAIAADIASVSHSESSGNKSSQEVYHAQIGRRPFD